MLVLYDDHRGIYSSRETEPGRVDIFCRSHPPGGRHRAGHLPQEEAAGDRERTAN